MELNIQNEFEKIFPRLKEYELTDLQVKSVKSIVEKGKNTLSIIQTGGGKSLIYWLSGKLLGGITIVISPLIALMEEQAEKLEENNCSTLMLHGQADKNEQYEKLIEIANGKFKPDFIFVSPERMATDGFFEYCVKRINKQVKLIVVDEVHCVSQWGENFRPFYRRIKDFIDNIYENDYSKAKVLALTATINPKEIKDICEEFQITTEGIVKSDMLMRNEIALKVIEEVIEDDKEEHLWNIIKLHKGEKTLVYVYRKYNKRGVEQLAQIANERGYRAIYFHGDMTANERKNIISKYKNNEYDIVFATNAFGMGIDIEDIRVVVHFSIPESIEQYYQEVGRAARDAKKGGTAVAYLLYSDKNILVKRKHFINNSYPSLDMLKNAYKKISNKVGLNLLYCFDDEEINTCLPYFVNSGLIEIVCKGFSTFENMEIQDEYLKNALSKTIRPITTIVFKKNPEINPKEIINKTYEDIISGKIKLNKLLDKVLIIDVKEEKLSDEKINEILKSIEDKKEYRNELFNYFVYILKKKLDSNFLHQEIANYLGVDRYKLGRVYSTSKGDRVRSKSEVIIANLLYEHNINYKYEEKLICGDKEIYPDFTIYLDNGEKVFWEHLGWIGIENYDKRWIEKLELYEKYYNVIPEKTYETASISDAATKKIEEIQKRNAN